MVSRRAILTGLSGIAAGGVGMNMMSQDATAQVTVGGFSVSDAEKETNQPINGATVDVSGTYRWGTTTQPTRAVLRLEGKHTDSYTQLDATELPTAENSGEYELQGSLLDINGISAPDLTPASEGETTRTDVSIRVTLTVYHDGSKTASQAVKDTATITVTDSGATATVEIGGSGDISLSTG